MESQNSIQLQAFKQATGYLIDAAAPVFETCEGDNIMEFTIPADTLEDLRKALLIGHDERRK